MTNYDRNRSILIRVLWALYRLKNASHRIDQFAITDTIRHGLTIPERKKLIVFERSARPSNIEADDGYVVVVMRYSGQKATKSPNVVGVFRSIVLLPMNEDVECYRMRSPVSISKPQIVNFIQGCL